MTQYLKPKIEHPIQFSFLDYDLILVKQSASDHQIITTKSKGAEYAKFNHGESQQSSNR